MQPAAKVAKQLSAQMSGYAAFGRYAALDAHPWVLALVNLSEPAMDIFLIMCGFLAAHSLGSALPVPGTRPRKVGKYECHRAYAALLTVFGQWL